MESWRWQGLLVRGNKKKRGLVWKLCNTSILKNLECKINGWMRNVMVRIVMRSHFGE